MFRACVAIPDERLLHRPPPAQSCTRRARLERVLRSRSSRTYLFAAQHDDQRPISVRFGTWSMPTCCVQSGGTTCQSRSPKTAVSVRDGFRRPSARQGTTAAVVWCTVPSAVLRGTSGPASPHTAEDCVDARGWWPEYVCQEGGGMNPKVLYVCGMLAPAAYIVMTIVGGALRPGYSHLSDTVSELLSPGSPNRPLLVFLQIIQSLLGFLFGYGVLQFVQGSEHTTTSGVIGAGMVAVAGVVTVGTAIFPQMLGARQRLSRARSTRSSLVLGVLLPLSILSMLLLGVWSRQTGILPGFGTYSFVTVGITVLLADRVARRWERRSWG